MAYQKKIQLTNKEKEFIDSCIRNAYQEGFREGFGISGKQFNGMSGFLDSVDVKNLGIISCANYMVDHNEFFKSHYTKKQNGTI
jgi:hypothetical protein